MKEFLDNEDESDDPTTDLYLDGTSQIVSTMRTRAMEFQEPINPKSGFYLEAEFQGRHGTITVNAILDGAAPVLLETFTLGPQSLIIPLDIPFDLPGATWRKRNFPLNTEFLPPFRSIQIEVIGVSGNMVLRNLILSAFLDTVELSREVILSG